jgi:PST family polysaccharide transporter
LRPGEGLVIQLTAIAASGFLFEAFQTLAIWFQSQTQAKYAVMAKSSILILINMIKIGLLLSFATIHAFAWAALLESLLVAVTLTAIYRFKGNAMRSWSVSRTYLKALLRDCWPMALSGLVVIAYGRLAQLMIGGMRGNEAVGIFSAASRISEAWTFIPLAVISSAFPSLVAARGKDPALYYRRMQTLCNVILMVGLAAAIPMTFLATPVVLALFGEAYADAGPVLAINLWGSVFMFLGMVQSGWYVAEGLTRMALLRTLLCALLNAVLNVILIPRYSYTGAACATAISHAVNAFALNLFDSRTRPFFFLQLRAFTFRSPVFRWSEPKPLGG